MKKIQILLLLSVILANSAFCQKLVIMHTNDIHSKITGFGPENSYTPMSINDDSTLGGLARLATLITGIVGCAGCR